MRTWHSLRLAAILIILAGLVAGAVIAAVLRGEPAHGQIIGCPVAPYQRCIMMPAASTPRVGQEITAGSGSNPGTPWMITDYKGAPMAWVNWYGLYSGGDGGKMPGGLICVTYGTRSTSACLTPQGTLQLQVTGPDGPTGPVVTLTPADITYLHSLETKPAG